MNYDPERYTWSIRKNDKECARSTTRAEADRIIVQLKKISPNAQFTVHYEGKSIRHCDRGGKPLG
jgi:hypothetical protein